MLNIIFNNNNLTMDIEKIESFDVPITVSKAHDVNLDYPFTLDVEDNSYFYVSKKNKR